MTREEYRKWKKKHVFLIKDFDDYFKIYNNSPLLEKMTEKDFDDELKDFTNVYEEERNNQLQYLSDKYHITKEIAYEIYPVYKTLCELHNGEEPPKSVLKHAIGIASNKLHNNI